MNPSSLEHLHRQFSEVNKNQTYMGVSPSDPNKLEQVTKKSIHLHEVFKIAQKQIEKDLKIPDPKESANLRLLEQDGKACYKRYKEATNTWVRLFLKNLPKYTPAFLKQYLPSCFSNDILKAETDTKRQYQSYKALIKKKLDDLSKIPSVPKSDPSVPKSDFGNDLTDELLNQLYDEDDLNKTPLRTKKEVKKPLITEDQKYLFDMNVLDDDQLDEKQAHEEKNPSKPTSKSDELLVEKSVEKEEILLTPPPQVLTDEEIEKIRQKALTNKLNAIAHNINFLNESERFPLSLQMTITILLKLTQNINQLLSLDPINAKNSLEKIGLSEAEYNFLMHDQLRGAIFTDNNTLFQTLLEPTKWANSLGKAFDNQGIIKFAIQRIANNPILILMNEKNGKVKESELKNYQGEVQVSLGDSLNELEELAKYLKNHDTCRPCAISIKLGQLETLTPQLVKLILELSDRVAEINITGLYSLNFKKAAISSEEELQLIRRFDRLKFPDLMEIILSDHSKKDWSVNDFSTLLSTLPSCELLRKCFRLCPSPQDIEIPIELMNSQIMNFEDFDLEHIPYLLSQFPQLAQVSFSGLTVTDAQLGQWIASNYYLANVKSLQLKDCQALTTDILHALISLQNLTNLSIPDLPLGKLPLNKLPTFDNPFKINIFYTTAKATQKIAAQKYTGPLTWAPVFQIPMARNQVSEIFTSTMKILDPKSVSYWLFNDDYKNLQPQTSIIAILADSNDKLNDDNLVEFVQKFPSVTALSLYNCPNLTSDGIIKMLKVCPHIRTLDLMGCSHITEELFFGGNDNMSILKKLNKIIVTDTGISEGIAKAFKEGELPKLEFEATTLTITDDQLGDEQALENILKSKTLTKIKRLNLEGCTELTNQMLGQVLDHLNTDIWIKTKDGITVENPQRLNLATLNISKCPHITEEAFHDKKVGDKIEPKLLENLHRIIMGGTKISKVLNGIYPQVIFQAAEGPVTIQINPDHQLQMCLSYYKAKEQILQGDPSFETELKKIAPDLIHNRITVELFASQCSDKASVKFIQRMPINTNDPEFCDISLIFKTTDDADPVTHLSHRDVLYSKSLYFLNAFRPGGMLSHVPGIDYVNLHATPKAAQVVMDIFYGKAKIEDLDWQTAADAAELAGPEIFKLPKSNCQELFDRIHCQFDTSRAENMFLRAKMLNDSEGVKQYEATLLAYLESFEGHIDDSNRSQFQSFVNIATEYNLTELKAKTTQIQESLNKKLIQEETDQQNRENEAKNRAYIQNEQFLTGMQAAFYSNQYV